MKKTTKAAAYAAKPMTAEERAAYFERYVTDRMSEFVALGKLAREKLAADMSSGPAEAMYRFCWLDGYAKDVHLEWLALSFVERVGTDGLDKAAEMFTSYLTNQVEAWTPQRSTSGYSNLANDEKLLAMKEVLRVLKRHA